MLASASSWSHRRSREFLGLQIPNPFWPSIVAAFLWYTAATLILSSRDIQVFASIVYWEALLRFAAVGLLVAYGFTYVGVLPTVLFAITDFAWGSSILWDYTASWVARTHRCCSITVKIRPRNDRHPSLMTGSIAVSGRPLWVTCRPDPADPITAVLGLEADIDNL